MERACKLVLVIDHLLEHGKYPTPKALRSYGHNLRALLDNADGIAETRWPDDLDARLPREPIHDELVGVLTDFAANLSRYYNLEVLGAEVGKLKGADPITDWHERVTRRIIAEKYPASRVEKDRKDSQQANALLGATVFVHHVDEDGSAIDDYGTGMVATRRSEYARPWERLYVLQIARFLARLLWLIGTDATKQGHYVPAFGEIFGVFNQPDNALRRRKGWSTIP